MYLANGIAKNIPPQARNAFMQWIHKYHNLISLMSVIPAVQFTHCQFDSHNWRQIMWSVLELLTVNRS